MSQRNISSRKSAALPKAPLEPMSDIRKLEVTAQFTDDVMSKLASAFFEVIQQEGWGKRDLSQISGINETGINHILAGRRKNLTVETIALITRAMRKRPELVLHDLRPVGNRAGMLDFKNETSAAAALQERQVQQPRSAAASLSGADHERKRAASLEEAFS